MKTQNKIKKNQLKLIKDSQNELNTVFINIGIIEAQKQQYLQKAFSLNENLESIKKELENEYGLITINLEDGSYEKINKE